MTTNNLSQKIKQRLNPNRPMTSITVRMPDDVIDSLKTIAPLKGFSGYQALLKHYVSEGLRVDEAKYLTNYLNPSNDTKRLIDALKNHGVSQEIIDEAVRDVDLT